MDQLAPLRGIRVLDFCWVLAGPLGTRLLSNFGAEVIRVESHARLDAMRRGRRPDGTVSLSLGPLFNDANTGKLSVNLDLHHERARELVEQLVAVSDVVTNNFRAGALERMGFGYDVLRRLNPRIVLLNMPGCGRTGPWANRGTLGGNIMGASGLNSITGFPGRPPYGLGCAYPDFTSPYLAATVVLAALREQRRTGEGQELDLSQLSATISLLGVEWVQFARGRVPPQPKQNRDPNYCPHGVYPAAGNDEWCAIAVEDDAEWAAICQLMDRAELTADPRFLTHEDRKANEDAVDDIVAAWTGNLDRWEIADLLQERGVAAAAVEDLSDTIERDPQLYHHYERVRQPDEPESELMIDGEAIRFAGVDHPLERAPLIGEHSEYVLCDLLGLAREEFDALVVDGVVN